MLKRIFLATLLLATPALAQVPQQPPPPIPMPQDLLQRISIYLQEGGTHNEGYALAKAIEDVIALQQMTKDRDSLKSQIDVAKPKPPDAATTAKPAAK